ncbi:DUF4836 family protein [Saprospira grandis]|uniref:DUF4836 family protein n=1 Tax=Saprospira grandis TaxID=1008 RepID=UPI0022DE3DCE|nr:DUF4836 family protein [Saprospira grandis]WBM74339.1 DUF4836 family protein [Saprospira grandis]
MKQQLSLIFLAFTLGIFVISCGGRKLQQDSLARISASEKVVFSLNWQALMSKLDEDFLMKAGKGKSKTEEFIKTLRTKPERIGFAKGQTAYGYISLPEGQQLWTLIIPLAKVEKLKAYIEGSDRFSLKKKEGYHLLESSEPLNYAVGFDEDHLVLSWGALSKLNAHLKQFFEQKPANSMADNASLKKLFSKGDDVKVWLSSKGVYESWQDSPSMQEDLMILGLLGVTSEEFADNSLGISLNFDQGQLAAQLGGDYSEKLEQLFGPVFNEGIGEGFRNFIPAKDYAGGIALSTDSEQLSEYLAARELRPLIDEFLAGTSISGANLLEAMTGNVAWLSYEIEEAFVDKLPSSLLIIEFKDKAHLDKLVDQLATNNFSVERDQHFIKAQYSWFLDVMLIQHDNYLIITNYFFLGTAINEGLSKSELLPKKQYEKLTQGAFALDIVNVKPYMDIFKANNSSALSKAIERISFSAQGRQMELLLLAKDKKTNALEQLINQVN